MNIFDSLKAIPQTRLLGYLFALGLLPIIFLAYSFFASLEQIHELNSSLQNIEFLARQVENKQAANLATIEHYRNADHFYIDKNLETLEFLQPEIAGLKKVMEDPNFIEDDGTRKRLAFLTSKQNKLSFAESNVQSSPHFQEVTETLLNPVEVSSSDLKNILSLIEGQEIDGFKPAPNRPQLILTDFKLEKKATHDHNEVFILNMKLLKREFQ